MQKCMKRCTKCWLLLLVLSMVMIYQTEVMAAADVSENGISVTNITSTSAYVNWTVAIQQNAATGFQTQSVDATLWSANYGTQVMCTQAQVVGGTLTGLHPGTYYMIELTLNGTDSLGTPSTRYASVSFTTDGAANVDVDVNVPTGPTVPTPSVKTATMSGKDLQVVAGDVDVYSISKLEWQVLDVKNGNKVVATDTSYSTGTTIYDLGRKIYGVQCRAVATDANYNPVYSEWSKVKYVIAQPKITSKKKDIKSHKLTVKFSKIKGAKSYTIYMRKHGTKKWTKVKTTTSNSVVITKFKKKTLTINSTGVDVCVVANAKVGGKSISSKKIEATNFYIIRY